MLYCNAFITCTSTGKAAVAIDGTTVHTALKITTGKNYRLSYTDAMKFRSLFKYVRAVIIDGVSMASAEIL